MWPLVLVAVALAVYKAVRVYSDTGRSAIVVRDTSGEHVEIQKMGRITLFNLTIRGAIV